MHRDPKQRGLQLVDLCGGRLERLGRERALIYKVLLLTGLRKAELASLTVGQLALDRPQPYVELLAKDEKAGRGATIPLRSDLVADLREHLAQAGRSPLAEVVGHPDRRS